MVRDDKIDMRTVSDTSRAAIVNWLVVNCSCMVFNSTTDDEIAEIWGKLRGDAFLGKVIIQLSPDVL